MYQSALPARMLAPPQQAVSTQEDCRTDAKKTATSAASFRAEDHYSRICVFYGLLLLQKGRSQNQSRAPVGCPTRPLRAKNSPYEDQKDPSEYIIYDPSAMRKIPTPRRMMPLLSCRHVSRRSDAVPK